MTGATCQDFVRNWTRGTEDKTFTKAAVSFKNQLIIKNRFGSKRKLGNRGYKGSQSWKARRERALGTVSVFSRVSTITYLLFANNFDQLYSKKYSVSREQ